ncbi:hypothetical protein ACFQ0B_46390 [Nonomuraea thailandensis]
MRDHLKAIFTKVDVSSRGELVARLFGEHANPPARPRRRHRARLRGRLKSEACG